MLKITEGGTLAKKLIQSFLKHVVSGINLCLAPKKLLLTSIPTSLKKYTA